MGYICFFFFTNVYLGIRTCPVDDWQSHCNHQVMMEMPVGSCCFTALITTSCYEVGMENGRIMVDFIRMSGSN